MTLKLYGTLTSPPVRAVILCAKALGVELELVPVNLEEKDHLKPNFLKKNPQHTVPLLEEEDGFLLADSHAIMSYLVAQHGKNDALYPSYDNRLRAAIDHILHLDSGVLFVRGLSITKGLKDFGRKPSKEQLNDLTEAFQILERILGQKKRPFIAGEALSIADFSVVTSVTSWNVYVPYAQFPNLKAYVERIQTLSFYEYNKEGLGLFVKAISEALNK